MANEGHAKASGRAITLITSIPPITHPGHSHPGPNATIR